MDLSESQPPYGTVRALRRDERGATLMEYIMLAGLVAIAAFAGFKLFGQDVQNAISGQANTVQSIPTAAQ